MAGYIFNHNTTNTPINKTILSGNRKDLLYPGGLGASRLISDPFIGGYSFFFFIEVPTELYDLLYNNSIFEGLGGFNFFDLLQYTFGSFDGIADMNLSSDSITSGWSSNELKVAKEIAKGTSEVNLGHQELAGGVYGEYYRRWVSSIRHPQNNVCSFSSSRDYKVSGLYFNTSPNIGVENDAKRRKMIERAFIFTDMYPSNINLAHHNQSKGSHDLFEFNMPFTADMYIGYNIDELARSILGSKTFYNKFIKNPMTQIASMISGDSGVDVKLKAEDRISSLFGPEALTTFKNIQNNGIVKLG